MGKEVGRRETANCNGFVGCGQTLCVMQKLGVRCILGSQAGGGGGGGGGVLDVMQQFHSCFT